MTKAMLGFLTLGFALASVAANAESETAKHRFAAGAIESRADSMQVFNGRHSWENSSDKRFAFDGDRDDRSSRLFEASRQTTKPRLVTPTAVAAPEIDPASAASGFTLLLGGLAVVLARRKRIG
jgi:hypothetical protein